MDRESVWQEYKAAWAQHRSPPMDDDTFIDLFHDAAKASEALALIKSSKYAVKTMKGATKDFSRYLLMNLNDDNRSNVWSALQGPAEFDNAILAGRLGLASIGGRAEFVARVAVRAIVQFGRAWVRERLSLWWTSAAFTEEEGEALLGALLDGAALNGSSLTELGPKAQETLRRLARSGRVTTEQLTGFDASAVGAILAGKSGSRLAPRIGGLLQCVSVRLDIRDACLQPAEFPVSASAPLQSGSMVPTALRRAVYEAHHRYGLPVDSIEGLFREYGEQLLRSSAAEGESSRLSFPLIRLLHLRLLLESPSLAKAVGAPEQFLVPEVLTFTLGQDTVSYSPELRVYRDADRRWRARWAESAGEAMSVLFMESTVGIDLTTLERIPETNEQRSADFVSRTAHGEPIVFESKGSTTWTVHREQRRSALEQLGKLRTGNRKTKGKEAKAERVTWPGEGRAFALALFASQQGDERSSLLHVEDPPFTFRDLFGDGWEGRARRNHFSAVLESAQLFGVADNLRNGRATEQVPEPAAAFSLRGTRDLPQEDAEPTDFVGSFLPVGDIARRLRHPDPVAVEKLQVFVGVERNLFDSLRRNELPARPLTPSWGALPENGRGRTVRGVYSLLSDGSFLAVGMEESEGTIRPRRSR